MINQNPNSVYCMRIKTESAKIKTITKEQMESLQTKTRGNVDRMLQFLYQIIGYPDDKKYVLSKSMFTNVMQYLLMQLRNMENYSI